LVTASSVTLVIVYGTKVDSSPCGNLCENFAEKVFVRGLSEEGEA